MTAPFPAAEYGEDVTSIELGDKTVLLIGTAHVSQQSADLVADIIKQEQPDTVCIELDAKRYKALADPESWQNLDLKEVIRKKQLSTLLVSLLLSSYQKKLGGQLGVKPGTELLRAAQAAEESGARVDLCDRDVRVTLRRAWKATSFFKKSYLVATIFAGLFDSTELDEEKLAELRKKDVLAELMNEIGEALPDTKRVMIDERDIFMAEKIKKAPGKRLVAVVGAGHREGIEQRLCEDNSAEMEEINTVPPISGVWKTIGWSIPALIILSIVLIGFKQGASEAGANVLYWILANGIPSAVGAVLAMAHPATIFSAFAAAPLTSLTPVIGAGYVCAFIQVMTRPPVVKELENVGKDIGRFTGSNRLLRVFLVFILTGLGSIVGTYVGGYKIISNLLS
jgi:pheromone shutdown-related protein TraB